MLKNLGMKSFNLREFPALTGLLEHEITMIRVRRTGMSGKPQTQFVTDGWYWTTYRLSGDRLEEFHERLPHYVAYEYLEEKWLVPSALRFKEMQTHIFKGLVFQKALFHGIPGKFYFGPSYDDAMTAADKFLENRKFTRKDFQLIADENKNELII